MKKIIQISLVVILVFGLFQVVAAAPQVASGTGEANVNSSALSATAEDAQMATTCLVRVKGVICVQPKVGWNS